MCDVGHRWRWHNLLVAKIEMRVVHAPAEGTREVLTSKHAGSIAIKGTGRSASFLCGNCRDLLVKSVGPDEWIAEAYDPDTEEFTPLYRVRDVVFKCKGCGAFNEVADRSDLGDQR
jgi:hypothetical protein